MKTFKNISYPDIFTVCCGLILFLLCVFPRWVSLSIVLLGVIVVVGYVKKQILFRWNWTGILLIALYLAYVIGTFFTDFPQIAFKLLEHKLSFILLPLLLMIQFKETFSYRNVFVGLLLGCVVGVIVGLVHAYSCYQSIGEINCWRTVHISPIIHPSYFAAYISITLLYLWNVCYNKRNAYFFGLCCIFTSLSLLYILYTESLAGMLFVLLLIAAVCICFIYVKWKWIGLISCITLVVAGVVLIYRTSSIFSGQIYWATKASIEYMNYQNDYLHLYYPYDGSTDRIIMWQMSWEQLCETPWGVGTGNIDHVLQQRMEGRVHPLFIEENLNPHNQYLHTGVELGIIGLGIFLTLLIHLFIYSIRHRNWILLTVLASLAFNCLFESMLQRQSGIVFYTLMFCLLSIPTLSDKK